MSAEALPHFKGQAVKIKRADALQRALAWLKRPARHMQARRHGRPVARQQLADAHIGRVHGVALAQIWLPRPLPFKVLQAFAAHVHIVVQVQKAAVVHVRVGDDGRALAAAEMPGQRGKRRHGLLPHAGKARVHEQHLAVLLDHGHVAARGRLGHAHARPAAALPLRQAHFVGEAPAGVQLRRKFPDVFKCLVGGLVAAVQHLHHLIGVDHQLPAVLLVKPRPAPHFTGKVQVKCRVVQVFFRMVIVDHPHGAQRGSLAHKAAHGRFILHQQAHSEMLARPAVFLRTDVGNIEMKAVDQLQHGQHLAGPVLKLKFQKDHRGRALPVGQVAHGPKLPLHAGKLVRRALHLDEENVHIHGLVVAHARNVRACARNAAACFQKSAHAVGHGGGEGLPHGQPSLPCKELDMQRSRSQAYHKPPPLTSGRGPMFFIRIKNL